MNVLEVFELACHSAGTVSQPRQRHVEIAVDKGGGDYATTADIDAGAAMEATIKYNMPDIPIVPEEPNPYDPGRRRQPTHYIEKWLSLEHNTRHLPEH